MTSTTARPPRLAPPGAGIPAIERLVGGTIFALRRWRATPQATSHKFEDQRRAIARLYQPLDHDAIARRVLIPRLRGLEDSSRFWSVAMTLDHLRIVNQQIASTISSLVAGSVPPGRASTAAVKPAEGVDAAVIAPYEASCDTLLAAAAAHATNLRTPLRYAHPWFGPLDAAGWHAMAAMHMGIHRAQIARILADRPTP